MAQQDPLKCAIQDCLWTSPSPKGPASCKRWVLFFERPGLPFLSPASAPLSALSCKRSFSLSSLVSLPPTSPPRHVPLPPPDPLPFLPRFPLPFPPLFPPRPRPRPPRHYLSVVFLFSLAQYHCALDACQASMYAIVFGPIVFGSIPRPCCFLGLLVFLVASAGQPLVWLHFQCLGFSVSDGCHL